MKCVRKGLSKPKMKVRISQGNRVIVHKKMGAFFFVLVGWTVLFLQFTDYNMAS